MNTPTSSESPTDADRAHWFSREVHAHDSSLKAYLRGSFPQVRDVDDVVQESYLRIWKAKGTQPIQCVRGFLFRVARNVALNLLNRQRVSRIDTVKDLSALPVAGDDATSAAAAARSEELALLADAIDSLPPRCREIVILRRIQNLSQREIAQRLGISEETVAVQVVRGVKRCGDYLRSRGMQFDDEARR